MTQLQTQYHTETTSGSQMLADLVADSAVLQAIVDSTAGFVEGTATAGDATSLTDTALAMDTDVYVGGTVIVYRAGVLVRTATILSNTATKLTVASGAVIAIGDTYVIGTLSGVNTVTKSSQTGEALMPSGTTAERGATPLVADLRYNTTLLNWEFWTGAAWEFIARITSLTGSLILPSGTTAERDAAPVEGMVRWNSTLTRYEGWDGAAWSALGGGATGGSSDAVFHENDQTVTADYTITAGKNAVSAGAITINTGVTVTIPTGARWVVV